MTVEERANYDSQSNGLVEGPVRDFRGVARTLRYAVSELHGTEPSSHHPIFLWLIARAAGQMMRCQIGSDIRPLHERRWGRRFRKDLPAFAETVRPPHPAGESPSRLHDKWQDRLSWRGARSATSGPSSA